MGDDTTQEADTAGDRGFSEALEEAQQEVEEEFQEAESDSENIEEQEPAAQTDDSSVPEDVKEDGEAEGETSESQESLEDDEVKDGEEGPVPYERFKEVNEERKEFKEQAQEANQQLNYLLETQEGQQELADYLREQNPELIQQNGDTASSDDEPVDDSEVVEDAISDLSQYLPQDAVDSILKIAEQNVQESDNDSSENESGDELPEPDPEEFKENQQRIREKIEDMQESDGFERLDEVTEPVSPDEPNKTLMDEIVQENPDRWLNYKGLVPPGSLEDLYQEAVQRLEQPDQEEFSGSDKSKEEIREEVRQEVIEEMEQNAEDEPMEPQGGSAPTSSDNGSPANPREAIEQAAEEEGISLQNLE